jgi:hypothetical protein
MTSDVVRPRASGTALDATARLIYIVAGIGIAFDVAGLFQYASGSKDWTLAVWQLPLNLGLLGCGLLVKRGKRWGIAVALAFWCANAIVSWIFWHGVVALVLAIFVAVVIARPLTARST